MNEYSFAKTVLDKNLENFVIQVVALEALELAGMIIHPFWLVQVLPGA